MRLFRYFIHIGLIASMVLLTACGGERSSTGGGSSSQSGSTDPSLDTPVESDDGTETLAQKQVRAFEEDLETWEGKLHIDPSVPSFNGTIDSISTIATADLYVMLQSVVLTTQHAALIAVPELAMEAACDNLGNPLAVFACKAALNTSSLEQLCNNNLDFEVFGVRFCDFINNIALPIIPPNALPQEFTDTGPWVSFAMLDGEARVYNEWEGMSFDVTLSDGRVDGKQVDFTVQGTVVREGAVLTIHESTISFSYEQPVDGSGLRLPLTSDSELSIEYDQPMDGINANPVSYVGAVTITAALTDLTQSFDQTVLGTDGIPMTLVTNGAFSDYRDNRFQGSVEIEDVTGDELSLEFSTTTPDASRNVVVQVTASPEEVNLGLLSLAIVWDGKAFDINYDVNNPSMVTVTNHDGLSMQVDFSLTNNAGTITREGTLVGTVDIRDGKPDITLIK